MHHIATASVALACLAAGFAHTAHAQRAVARDYPTRLIRVVVPYAAGAGPDVVGRTLAEKLSASLGQNIVFENRGGGGGIIGTDMVAKAQPDGYTLLLQTANYASYPLFNKSLPYDPTKDLIPVALLAKTVGYVVVVNPSLPVRSVKDLVALARAHPGKLHHGTSGAGAPAELFAFMTGVTLTAVRYTGVPAVLTNVVSGQIEMAFPAAPSALPFIQAGRLRVLAISAEKRWSRLPEAPTLVESGLKDYKLIGWYGFWFPGGTPVDYVNRIHGEVAKAVADPAIRQRFDDQGLEGVGAPAADLAKIVAAEYAINKKLVDSGRIVPQ